MSAWANLYVPAPVEKALAELGFTTPTPIQDLTLASAIRDKMDIVGAAETVSSLPEFLLQESIDHLISK